jgi:hypothetical protein
VAVSGAVKGQIKISAALINEALRGAAVSDFSFPQSWDGTEIGVEFGPAVLADYGVVQLAQAPPYTLVWPDSFPVADFLESALRILGMTAADARSLRNGFAENPAALMFIPPDAALEVQEVHMGMGPWRNPRKGMLLRDNATQQPICDFCPGPSETILIWNTPEGVFALKGPVREAGLITFAHSLGASLN